MDITRWSTSKSDWLYALQPKMEKLYTVSKNNTRSWLWLRSWTLFAKLRLKLKKIRKITRPLRNDLNQIPYDYTVEVTNRFKGLDLIDRVPEELWTEVHDIVQEAVIKTIPKKKKCKKAKWLSELPLPDFCQPCELQSLLSEHGSFFICAFSLWLNFLQKWL